MGFGVFWRMEGLPFQPACRLDKSNGQIWGVYDTRGTCLGSLLQGAPTIRGSIFGPYFSRPPYCLHWAALVDFLGHGAPDGGRQEQERA